MPLGRGPSNHKLCMNSPFPSSSTDFYPFPPIWTADEDGLLMVGGSLAPEWLIAAYRTGIFPWPCETDRGMILAWFSPDPRAVLELEHLHVSSRLERRLSAANSPLRSTNPLEMSFVHARGLVMATRGLGSHPK